MVEIWKERVAQRQKRFAIEKGIIITIMTGAALFAASRQMKKGRGKDESICTSQSL
jgi:cysteine synthase